MVKGTSRSESVGDRWTPVDDRRISPKSLELVEVASRRLEEMNHDVAVVEQHPFGFRPALVAERLSSGLAKHLLDPVGQGLHVGSRIPGGYHEYLGDYEQISDFQQDDVLALLVGDGICGQPGKCHCVYGSNLLASGDIRPGLGHTRC